MAPSLSFRTRTSLLPLLCLQLLSQSLPQLTSTGSTFAFDGVSYYVPATPYTNIEHDFKSSLLTGKISAAGLIPVTVVSSVGSNFSQSDLEKTLRAYGADDVWSAGFLTGTCGSGRLRAWSIVVAI